MCWDGERDPHRQPFHHLRIWNIPIGSDARYVSARIELLNSTRITVDEDPIVIKPSAPMLDIYRSDTGWNRRANRYVKDGGLLFQAPISDECLVSPKTWRGTTPKSGQAVLMPDRRTIKQTQPFARCVGEYATSRYVSDDEDLYGMVFYGAHGRAWLSAIGGTLRVGELVPGAGPIPHVVKVNPHADQHLSDDEQTKGFRWPAEAADSYAPQRFGRLGSPPRACRMDSLLSARARPGSGGFVLRDRAGWSAGHGVSR
ncbi:MAG: hypothetical protein KatS3mg108_1193 [Isosphaeraceae bacterium]|nr:MAG: hypothetical protein KatS3mg108_1193 [Isosphaeraceae bacterium]